MKRRLFILAAFLFLGAILNVAIAWACVVLAPSQYTYFRQITALINDPGLNRISIDVPSGPPPSPTTVASGFNFAPEGSTSPAPLHSIPEDWEILSNVAEMNQRWHQLAGDEFSGKTYFAGWPCSSVGGEVHTIRPIHGYWSTLPRGEHLAGAIAIHRVSESGNARSSYAIPYTPIWPGFAINTIFYAAILWMMFDIAGVLRRKRRLARGVCPACAYPIGTSDVCTECGKPLPKRGRGVDQA